jgi:hypothetical protein
MKYRVFIQTNHRQMVGALVSKYSLERNSAHSDEFDVEIINHGDYPFFQGKEGQLFLRDRIKRPWHNDDLQSFTPTRFLPPELMGYEGRAVVIDPDVFAVGDIYELLSRDMEGKAILCRARSGAKAFMGCMASSVMLIDCAKLSHWRVEEQFNKLFTFDLDYMDWVCLKNEPKESIGFFENEWNDFDRLSPKTKLLHNTKRRTQPWKSGLPVDFTPADKFRLFPPLGWLMRYRRIWFGEYAFLGKYVRHPDRNQEAFFFGLLKECLEKGIVSEELLRTEMRKNHVRHDAMEMAEQVQPLAA